MNYDNPAARLLSLLIEGKNYTTQLNCRSVWEALLDVENNNSLLTSRLGKVMELPELTVQALLENDPSTDNTWNHWSTQINHAFATQNLNSTWATFIDCIDQHSITYLSMSAKLLRATSNTKDMLGVEMGELREKLDTILQDVICSQDMPAEVKKYLARNLRKLIISIDEYRLTGGLPILEAIEITVGHAAVDRTYASVLKDHEIGKRTLEILSAMANVVAVTVGVPQISYAFGLLPLLPA